MLSALRCSRRRAPTRSVGSQTEGEADPLDAVYLIVHLPPQTEAAPELPRSAAEPREPLDAASLEARRESRQPLFPGDTEDETKTTDEEYDLDQQLRDQAELHQRMERARTDAEAEVLDSQLEEQRILLRAMITAREAARRAAVLAEAERTARTALRSRLRSRSPRLRIDPEDL